MVGRASVARLRRLVRRRLPHGLIHWRYLYPGDSPLIRLHRQFWWQGKPDKRSRALWLTFEIALWLRWVLGSSWVACARVWLHQHRACPESESRQIAALLRWSIAWCIPPALVYRFALFDAQRALDYVFDHEAAAFHLWRSGPEYASPLSQALLQDKQACKALFVAEGLPTPLGRVIERSRSISFAEACGALSRCFCKQVHGNQGRHAFAAWQEKGHWEGRLLDGPRLADEVALDKAWQTLLASDAALIEELLENHPALAMLGPLDDAITLRVISERGGALCCAWLEVPVREEGKSIRYRIYPLALEDGCLLPELSAAGREAAPAIGPLPFWAEIVHASLAAQALFPDLYAIAWDWVLTPTGPVLLEGNSGWGTRVPQILIGPLLSSFSATG